MDSSRTPEAAEVIELTVDIVSAYVSNNTVSPSDLPALIASVSKTIHGLGETVVPEAEKPQPAVSIKKSITPDFLFSLEDGRKYKTLKRHLGSLGMTPAEYRKKWSLPSDYPMVAPNYARTRSELAKKAGLGQVRQAVKKPAPAVRSKVTAASTKAAAPKSAAPKSAAKAAAPKTVASKVAAAPVKTKKVGKAAKPASR